MSEYLLPIQVAFRPRRAATLIQAVVAWWRPFATVAVASVMVALISHDLAVNLTLSRLPPAASPEDRVQVRNWLDTGLPARTLLLPVRLAAESGLNALILLAFARAFTSRHSGSFRGFFVLSVSAAMIPLLGRCAAILAATAGVGGPSSFLAPPFSLATVLPPTGDYRFDVLLTSVNVSTLWYVGSVTPGVTVLCRCKAWKAVLVAVAAWTVSTASSITVLALLRNAFQFRL